MIYIKECFEKDESSYFSFLEQNEDKLTVLYSNTNSKKGINTFNKDFKYFLVYDDDTCIGTLKLYSMILIIDNTEINSGGISYFSLLDNLNPYCLEAVLDDIDILLEKLGYNITLLNRDNYTYRKLNYWPLGTIKNFTITSEILFENVKDNNDFIIKPADTMDIELLNEFYMDNFCYTYRTNDDWISLITNSTYEYYISTNGEEISYLAYCPQTNNIIELHGDIDCLSNNFKYIFKKYDLKEVNVQYNDIDFNISRVLYQYCKNCNMSPIVNMKVYNSTDTFNKLSYLIERQGYKFSNLSYEDEENLCSRILGFEYMPSNKYNFVKPTNINLSVADLK